MEGTGEGGPVDGVGGRVGAEVDRHNGAEWVVEGRGKQVVRDVGGGAGYGLEAGHGAKGCVGGAQAEEDAGAVEEAKRVGCEAAKLGAGDVTVAGWGEVVAGGCNWLNEFREDEVVGVGSLAKIE